MKKITYLVALMFGLSLITTSCFKKTDPAVDPDEGNDIEEVVFPENFDWKTFTDIEVTITSSKEGILTILSSDGLTTYHKAFLTAGNQLEFKLVVPTYEKKVKVIHKGVSVEFETDTESIVHNF